MKIGLVDHVRLDEDIFPDKLGGEGGIGQNSAYTGRGKHHVLWLLCCKKSFDFRGIYEIKLSVRPDYKVGVSTRLQPAQYGRTNQASVTCHENLVCLIHPLPIRAICR